MIKFNNLYSDYYNYSEKNSKTCLKLHRFKYKFKWILSWKK